MNQICLGIDIIEIERIRQALSVWGERFLRRVFTINESELYGRHLQSLAARFAGKEAVFKALSKPGMFFSWQDVEILSSEDGRPRLRLFGEALKRVDELKLKTLQISLSHSRENAIAVVVGFTE